MEVIVILRKLLLTDHYWVVDVTIHVHGYIEATYVHYRLLSLSLSLSPPSLLSTLLPTFYFQYRAKIETTPDNSSISARKTASTPAVSSSSSSKHSSYSHSHHSSHHHKDHGRSSSHRSHHSGGSHTHHSHDRKERYERRSVYTQLSL